MGWTREGGWAEGNFVERDRLDKNGWVVVAVALLTLLAVLEVNQREMEVAGHKEVVSNVGRTDISHMNVQIKEMAVEEAEEEAAVAEAVLNVEKKAISLLSVLVVAVVVVVVETEAASNVEKKDTNLSSAQKVDPQPVADPSRSRMFQMWRRRP